MPAGWAAAAGAVGSIAGGLIGAGGAEAASRQQVAMEQQALAQQQKMFDTEQSNEQPYMQAGAGAAGQLNYLLGQGGQTDPRTGQPITSSAGGYGSLNQQFNADTFKSMSPQYQFNLQQGGQGTLNQDSNAQGAESGAALKDLMSFNQGYANNSFNSAFQNYQTQQNNVFNRLSGIATLGSNAGSNSATGASQFSNSIGNTTSSIGASQAAGTVGAANALSGGVQGAAGAFYSQNALNQILNSGSTTKYDPGANNFGGGTMNTGTAGDTGNYVVNVPNQ
jgi:hypothetical protein